MKQALLDEVKGLSVSEAETRCLQAGHRVEVYERDAIITMQARGNTVLLFHDGGKVVGASAGDPLELDSFVRGG